MLFRTLFFAMVCLVSASLWGGQEMPLQEVVVERILNRMIEGKHSSFEAGLARLLGELKRDGYVWRVGEDAQLRPLFVTVQGLIEEALSQLLQEGTVTAVCGAIHTPMPSTPLCTDGTITEKLVDAAVEKDARRLVTVTFRAEVLRDYLNSGGKLFAVYPKGGDLKRTAVQQAVYRGLLAKYPKELFDFPLERSLPRFLIGATYRVIGKTGEEMVFAIGAVQANAPDDEITWRLWLGDPGKNQRCFQRLQTIESLMGEPLMDESFCDSSDKK